tara:strand:- start:406 stop:804 length:399 start_codon:yes stop_codon:yes gene_type:complete
MAEFGRVTSRTMAAAADMRTMQYVVLRAAAAGTTNQASNPSLDANEVIGVLQNKPNSGQAATVGYHGETKCVGGGTVTVNALVAPNGSGRVIDATSGDFVLGMALEAATTDGERVRVLLRLPSVQLPTSLNT